MHKTLDCTASLVVYNTPPQMLKAVVGSFLETRNLEIKLYIVDNSPAPALKEVSAKLSISYHFNGRNVGYGRGHNQAINQYETGKYHLILNPDIVFLEGVLEELVHFMDNNPEVGVVCPKVVYEDGTIQHLNKRLPTVYDLLLRRFLPRRLRFLFQYRLNRYEMRDRGYDTIYDVPFIPGAFMLCRTIVLKEVGGFDPRYFMYFEDTDLSRKVQAHGYKTIYYPFVSVTHLWARAPYSSIKMMLIMIMNGIRYFNKWGWKFF